MKYKLIMVVANIKHKSWWWNGRSSYQFETLDELLEFMNDHIPLGKFDGLNYMRSDINSIYENDKRIDNGRLACTSWYEIEKGEHQMTDCTSF